MEKLIKDLQTKIVEVLNLIDVQPEEIGPMTNWSEGNWELIPSMSWRW